MDRSWSLREWIGEMVAHWYILVLAFLLGGALGWGSAWIVPPTYEARAPLYVAFNSDALFTSPDDFKNAQFEEATDLMMSKAVFGELGVDDQNPGQDQFSVQWRNAGRWELVVRDQDSAQAARLATHWREIAFEQLSTALPHAFTLSQLDQEVNLVARNLSDNAQTLTRLDAVEEGLQTWLLDPHAGPTPPEARATLLAYAQEFSVPENFPDEMAMWQEYVVWVNDLQAKLEVKRGLLEAENEALQTRMVTLQADWEAEKAASLGLSAFLVVEMGDEVKVEAVRSQGLLALVGAFVGLLGWLGFMMLRLKNGGTGA